MIFKNCPYMTTKVSNVMETDSRWGGGGVTLQEV